MQVLLNLPVNNKNDYHKKIYPHPSFKMKMSELKGVDQFVARKYKINPQPIKTLENFQEHCKELAKKIKENNFLGKQEETKIQRKSMIEDWYKYITEENGAYTGAMILMIMSGITSGLKQTEDTLPPVLNKGVLANTVTNIQNELNQNEKAQLNFEKEYRLNLQKSILLEETSLDDSLNGWIEIPSNEHDPENFEANVDKLKMLSHNNWCTKSFNAEPYLKQGDFHVYMENGKPKLGVRFVGDEIEEIQGELNNSNIPLRYGDIAKEHIKTYKCRESAKYELEQLEKAKEEIERIKSLFPDGINNAPVQDVLEALSIECEKDSDSLLIISHYGDSKLGCSYCDIGIDEDRLFNEIKSIKEDAYFENSQVTNLGNLQSIGGDAWFRNSQMTNLSNLQSIGGFADFGKSQITNLGNLNYIGDYADFEDSKITKLGNLQSIGENAYFGGSQVTDLGNLESIDGDVILENSKLTPDDFRAINVGGEIFQ